MVLLVDGINDVRLVEPVSSEDAARVLQFESLADRGEAGVTAIVHSSLV